MIIWCCRI